MTELIVQRLSEPGTSMNVMVLLPTAREQVLLDAHPDRRADEQMDAMAKYATRFISTRAGLKIQ